MRKINLIIFLLSFFVLGGQAQPGGSNPLVTLQGNNIAVSEVLTAITQQTGLEFSFNSQSIDVDQTISISVHNAKLEKALKVFCEKINATFLIIEGQIILKSIAEEKPPPFFTLSGFVGDQESGESLIGVAVSLIGSARGVSTNAFGFYSIQLKPGNYQILYSYIGYEKIVVDLEVKNNIQKDVVLRTASVDLPDVIVETPLQNVLENKHAGERELSPEDLKNMPEFGGESGLVKGLQSLPGIKTHSDGSSFFYVRGGERDQNLIIIDDAPIYNPSHLFGFYSTVIPDFAKSIKVYSSDMPTNIGDRLSSIVSIRTKDGNLNKFVFSGAFNPLIYRLAIETPIVKKKGSIFTSFRRSRFEWIYRRNTPNANIGFGDFNFKLNYKFNNKNRLFFTTIWSADNYSDGSSTSGISWANLAATLRWNHIFGPKLFSNTTIYTGNYGYNLKFSSNNWQSGLGTLSLKSDFTHYVSPRYKAKFGLETQTYFINPGIFSIDSTIAVLPQIKENRSRKLTLYYQGTYDVSDRIKLSGGIRMVNWSNLGPDTRYAFDENYEVNDTIENGSGKYNNYLRVDPRLSLQYELDSTSLIKTSVGLYHQYLNLISNSQSPFTSFEVWLPASPNIKPQAAFQVAASYLKYLRNPGLEFSAALYYKKFYNQVDYKPHPTTLLNPLIEGELRFGTMQSYGLELMLKKELGRFNGWISYTFSRTRRNTPAINEGRSYRAFQDRPHDFSIMLNYQLKRRIFFSAYWTAYSGSAFTSPTGFYTFNGETIPIYDEKNNDRLPSYQRLDIAFKFILNKKPTARYQHSLSFSIYNFLAHKNVTLINFNNIPVEGDQPVVKANLLNETALTASQTDLIRFFPSLTYKFKL
jgi:carboxypeptidase-like protein